MGVQYIPVRDMRLALHVDVEVEQARARTFAHVLRKHGHVFEHRAFDSSKYKPLNPEGRCFDNAMETALAYDDLLYAEGFLLATLPSGVRFPMGHGWCVTKQGVVVDSTCHTWGPHKSIRYVGVPIKLEYSKQWKKRTGYYGCLDGLPDGSLAGVYVDPPSVWKEDLCLL